VIARPAASALAIFAGILLLATASAAADRWTLDRQHTEVRFSWDHLGLSRQSGEFTDFRGELDFTPTDPTKASVVVTIRVQSLATGVRELDTLLRSVDFLDAQRHPEITFKSTTLRQTGERTGEIDGELTLLAITKPVTLKAIWNFTGETPMGAINPVLKGKWVSGFSAEAVIKRSDWGLTRAIPLVSDELRIMLETEWLRLD
jgi:polyisoprenoid-binding protein YceI